VELARPTDKAFRCPRPPYKLKVSARTGPSSSGVGRRQSFSRRPLKCDGPPRRLNGSLHGVAGCVPARDYNQESGPDGSRTCRKRSCRVSEEREVTIESVYL